eukprot:3928730-Pyramimonas_sp.AAC.1
MAAPLAQAHLIKRNFQPFRVLSCQLPNLLQPRRHIPPKLPHPSCIWLVARSRRQVRVWVARSTKPASYAPK